MSRTNPNYSNASMGPQTNYNFLGTMTPRPMSHQELLNPYDLPMKMSLDAFRNGKLNPYYNSSAGPYANIWTGYGRDPRQLYTIRTCTGNVPMHPDAAVQRELQAYADL